MVQLASKTTKDLILLGDQKLLVLILDDYLFIYTYNKNTQSNWNTKSVMYVLSIIESVKYSFIHFWIIIDFLTIFDKNYILKDHISLIKPWKMNYDKADQLYIHFIIKNGYTSLILFRTTLLWTWFVKFVIL